MKNVLLASWQHPFAIGLHLFYCVGWLGVSRIVQANHSHLDACGRGTLSVYPVLIGAVVSLPYVLALVGFLGFGRARQLYALLLINSVATPVLLLAF